MAWSIAAPIIAAAIGAGGSIYSSNRQAEAAEKASEQQQLATAEPWSVVQPFLTTGFEEAARLLGIDVPPDVQRSLMRGFNEAMVGGTIQPSANRLLTDVLRGEYLGANPYLDAMYDRAARKITTDYQRTTLPTMGSVYQSQGRFGSGGYRGAVERSQDILAGSLGETASQMYGKAYEQERLQQMAALGLAPSIDQMRYGDIDRAIQYGMAPNEYEWQRLMNYMGAISGQPGGQTTRTANIPYFTNPVASGIGGALSGLSLYNMFNQAYTGTPQQTPTEQYLYQPPVDYGAIGMYS